MRCRERIKDYQYDTGLIITNIKSQTLTSYRIETKIVLEFGSETGVAEAQVRKEEILDIGRKLASQFTRLELYTVEGKMRFKEQLAMSLNRRFKSAQVR